MRPDGARGSPGSSAALVPVRLHPNARHGARAARRRSAQGQHEGHPVASPASSFLTQLATEEQPYTEVRDLFSKKALATFTNWLKTSLTV